ncbi:hypothetical protein AKJ16_DCAP19597 [Drosera capensis]
MLNAVKIMKIKSSSKRLMYVEAMVGLYITRVLVDTKMTHNFVSLEETKRLELWVVDEKWMLKTINSEAKPIHGVAHGVRLCIDKWRETIDLSVVTMDDYLLVLGLGFLDKMKTFPIPFASVVCIVKEDDACMVPMIRRKERTQRKVL